KADKTVEVRPVNIAISEGNLSQIASGVSPGESVVTDGQDKLQAGSRIEPHPEAASPTDGAHNAKSSAGQNPSSASSGGQNAATQSAGNGNSGYRGQRQRGQPRSSSPGTASQ